MALDDLGRLLESLEDVSLSFDSIASGLRFLSCTEGREISVQSTANLLARDEVAIEPILYCLEQVRILHLGRTSPGIYSLDQGRLKQIEYTTAWLTEHYDKSTIQSMASLPVSKFGMLYTVPANADIELQSTMTGQLLDLISNADQKVTIVIPFFSEGGVDTISEALSAATDRDVRVELLTRDLIMGSEQNIPYIHSILERMDSDGKSSRLSIHEFNRNQYPDSTLHAKVLIADSCRAYVGSSNLTDSSLRQSLETGVYFSGAAAAEFANDLVQFRNSDLFLDVTTEVREEWET